MPLTELTLTIIASDDHRAVGNARVAISGPDGRNATTGSDGTATFRGISPGTYSIRVTRDTYRTLASEILFSAGSSARTLTLEALGELSGRVEDASNSHAIASAEISVNSHPDLHGTTTATGGFNLGYVDPGNYELLASKNGFVPATLRVRVGTTSSSVHTLRLTPITARIDSAVVACPGHKEELHAVVTPVGGTIEWTVTRGAARIVDSTGAVTRTGETAYLHGITPEEIEVSLKYTHTGSHTTVTKRITIHAINYRVTRFTPNAGGFGLWESAAGAKIWNNPPGSAFSLDPKVKITVHSSCTRKDDCAKNHRVGWLQTMRTSTRVAAYAGNRTVVNCPMPIRDAWHDTLKPFYDGTFVKTFTGDGNEQIVHQEDSPSFPGSPAPWSNATGALQSIRLAHDFTAWLVVQNIEWIPVSIPDSFKYLKNIDWSNDLNSAIDVTVPVGSRAATSRTNTVNSGDSDGKGARTPVLSDPIFNTSASLAVVTPPSP